MLHDIIWQITGNNPKVSGQMDKYIYLRHRYDTYGFGFRLVLWPLSLDQELSSLNQGFPIWRWRFLRRIGLTLMGGGLLQSVKLSTLTRIMFSPSPCCGMVSPALLRNFHLVLTVTWLPAPTITVECHLRCPPPQHHVSDSTVRTQPAFLERCFWQHTSRVGWCTGIRHVWC